MRGGALGLAYGCHYPFYKNKSDQFMSEKKVVKKAIFPVAGLGTRFLPATKSIPKEMLTIVDRPIIDYAVQEAIEAGCETLIFITGRHKRSIEDYFDKDRELEAELKAKNKLEALARVQGIIPAHVNCVYIRQPEPLGLGHAILQARPLIGDDEPFAVLLPDDLIDGKSCGVMSQMVEGFNSHPGNILAVEQVDWAQVHQYGVVAPKSTDGRLMPLGGIVEKPARADAPSNWTVVGRYVLMPSVMDELTRSTPGAGGEIQLTDAIARSMANTPTFGFAFHGQRFDCGNKKGFLAANNHFANL